MSINKLNKNKKKDHSMGNTNETSLKILRAQKGVFETPKFTKIKPTIKAKTAAEERLNAEKINKDSLFDVVLNGKKRPSFINGRIVDTKITTSKKAISALNSIHNLMGFENAEQEFKEKNVSTTNLGPETKFFRLQQYHRDIPVFGRQLVLSTDGEGNMESLSGLYTPIQDESKATITENDAVAAIQKKEKAAEFSSEGLFYYVNASEKGILCWKICTPQNVYFVNAKTGAIEHSYATEIDFGQEIICSGMSLASTRINYPVYANNGTRKLYDVRRDISVRECSANGDRVGAEIFATGNDASIIGNQHPAAITAMNNMIKIFDYYVNVFGRRSADGNSLPIHIVVNYHPSNSAYTNAFYSSGYSNWVEICLGNGSSIARPVDVLAHEFTHAVENSIWEASSCYTGESGGINEAVADILGEFIQDGILDTMGEELTIGSIRRFDNPKAMGDPSKYSEMTSTEVHTCSCILSHAAYIMQKNWPTKNNSEELATIFYKSLFYLTPFCNFLDFRSAVLKAARTMKITAQKVKVVAQAFDEVEVILVGDDGLSYTLSGYVKDTSGNPIVDAKVTMKKQNNTSVYRTAYTSSDGRFELVFDRGYTYSLTFEADGYQSNSTTINLTSQRCSKRCILPTITLQSITTSRGYSLQGIVRDASTGNLLKDVTIRIKAGSGQSHMCTAGKQDITLKTDENGHFYTSAVKSGTYSIWACKSLDSVSKWQKYATNVSVSGNNSINISLPVANREFISEIRMASESTRAKALRLVPASAVLIDKDLNAGCGGKYIYCNYSYSSTATPITNIILIQSNSPLTWTSKSINYQGRTSSYTRINVNLNEGAKGEYIYLCYTKDTYYSPMTGIDVIFDNENRLDPWMMVTWDNTYYSEANVNEGNTGKLTYILKTKAEFI